MVDRLRRFLCLGLRLRAKTILGKGDAYVMSRKMCKDEDSDYMANLSLCLYTFAVDVNHSYLQEAPSIKWNFSKVAVVYVWVPRRQSGNIEDFFKRTQIKVPLYKTTAFVFAKTKQELLFVMNSTKRFAIQV